MLYAVGSGALNCAPFHVDACKVRLTAYNGQREQSDYFKRDDVRPVTFTIAVYGFDAQVVSVADKSLDFRHTEGSVRGRTDSLVFGRIGILYLHFIGDSVGDRSPAQDDNSVLKYAGKNRRIKIDHR